MGFEEGQIVILGFSDVAVVALSILTLIDVAPKVKSEVIWVGQDLAGG